MRLSEPLSKFVFSLDLVFANLKNRFEAVKSVTINTSHHLTE
jgi:hypothetical protein